MSSYRIVSQYSDLHDMKKISLLRGTSSTAAPRESFITYDKWCNFDAVRSTKPLAAIFSPINAWILSDVVVSDYYIIHKEEFLYVDSSIESGAYQGEFETEIANRLSKQLNNRNTDCDLKYEDEQALIIYNEGGGTWGHFLIQDLPKVKLFIEHFPDGKIALPIEHSHKDSPYAGSLMACGARPDQLLGLEAGSRYRFREAVLIDMIYDFRRQLPHPFALELFSVLAKTQAGQKLSEGKDIYLKRSPNYGRCVANSEQVDDVFRRHDIMVLESCDKTPFSNQIDVWSDASSIVSVLGSSLANMVFHGERIPILAISPDWFGDVFFYNLAAFLGLDWYELRCGRSVNKGTITHKSDFLVDERLLANCLNRME